MAFFSSIMSALECLLLGMEHMEIVLTFSFACFVKSLLGLFVVQRAVRLYRSASLIAFSEGIVMALSTGLITRFGAVKTWNEWNRRELGIFGIMLTDLNMSLYRRLTRRTSFAMSVVSLAAR